MGSVLYHESQGDSMKNNDFHRAESLEDRIFRSRIDSTERNKIISEFRPFIMNIASRETGGFVDSSSDESSIAMIAFNEAIDRYQDDRGAGFLRIAEITIKSRIIDYLRKESRFLKRHEFSFANPVDGEERIENELVDESVNIETEVVGKETIADFGSFLEDFGLNIEDLPDYTPKHKDARVNSVKIAKVIAETEELKKKVIENKKIPISMVQRYIDVSRKVIETNRAYILSVFIIFIKGNDSMRAFAEDFLREASNDE